MASRVTLKPWRSKITAQFLIDLSKGFKNQRLGLEAHNFLAPHAGIKQALQHFLVRGLGTVVGTRDQRLLGLLMAAENINNDQIILAAYKVLFN
jgi:hypothetical protein